MTDNDPPALSGEILPPTDTSGRWLPLLEAATALATSERTLRRWIDNGRYLKRLVNGRAEVFVPDGAPMADNPANPTDLAVPDTSVTDLVARLDRQAMTVTRQAVQITRLTADKQRLTERLDAAERRIEELERRRWWRWW